jgi:3-phenylpropionate/trans-cinnamate dioxygenase ferredoxin reductase component
MKHYQYLIIGGGLAGDAATKGIRELDAEGSIGLISTEPDPPYMRPNLSKGLWKGRPVDKIWRKTGERADLHLGRTVTSLNADEKTVLDSAGDQYSYEKLLIATGGTPKHLPFGKGNIIYYRDFQDYQRLRAETEQGGNHFVVIGGGFIGSEIAASLATIGKKITMIFPGDTIGGSIYPANLANFLNEYYREKGVELLAGEAPASVHKEGNRITIRTGSGRTLEADGVVAGIGIHPNLDLAKEAGIKTNNGIIVNERLETSLPAVYAAGDVASFVHAALEKRTRVEHEDNAVQMGKLAGRNMAGANETYTHIPMFYSDLFDLGYEAVGEMSSKMKTVEDWQEAPFKKGVVYYMEDGRVRGVLLWNVWDKVDAARALLQEKGPFEPQDLKGRITG